MGVVGVGRVKHVLPRVVWGHAPRKILKIRCSEMDSGGFLAASRLYKCSKPQHVISLHGILSQSFWGEESRVPPPLYETLPGKRILGVTIAIGRRSRKGKACKSPNIECECTEWSVCFDVCA